MYFRIKCDVLAILNESHFTLKLLLVKSINCVLCTFFYINIHLYNVVNNNSIKKYCDMYLFQSCDYKYVFSC